MALAAITKNIMEAIVGAVAFEVGLPALASFIGLYRYGIEQRGRFAQSWIDYSIETGILMLGGACAVILYQYVRRRTLIGRWAFGIVALGAMLAPRVTLQTAFAMETRLAADPGSANGIGIQFVDDHFVVERKLGPNFSATGDAFVLLPMQATGFTGPGILWGAGSSACG